MIIESVFSPSFAPYGKVVKGMDSQIAEILSVLEKSPIPADGSVVYTPEWKDLQDLPAAGFVSAHLYGGMPIQMGYCNGHNTKMNCLEYHRDSEFNLGVHDFVLLLAREDDIIDGRLDSSTVKAFRAPAGVMVEVYATSLHYAPCHTDPEKGFQVLVVLPKGTNYDKPEMEVTTEEDKYLFASNKWLLAHPDAAEASQGAVVCIDGKNIDIAE